jgi:CBS domain-containing protein
MDAGYAAHMKRTVSEVMTKTVVALPDETNLVDAARAMREKEIGNVIVTRQGVLTGLATDRDIVIRGVAEGLDPRATRLSEVVTGPPVAIVEDAPIADAVALMGEKAVRRLVVTDRQGNLTGVVSIGDLAAEKDPHSALGVISSAPANS